MRVWKQIDRLYRLDGVGIRQQGDIAGLGERIATDVDEPLGPQPGDLLYDFRMDPGARRIGDEHVGLAVFVGERRGKNLEHIAADERGVLDTVGHSVGAGIRGQPTRDQPVGEIRAGTRLGQSAETQKTLPLSLMLLTELTGLIRHFMMFRLTIRTRRI